MKKGRLYALMGFVVLVVGTALYTVNFLYEKEQTSQAIFDTKSPEVGNVILKTGHGDVRTAKSGSVSVPSKPALNKDTAVDQDPMDEIQADLPLMNLFTLPTSPPPDPLVIPLSTRLGQKLSSSNTPAWGNAALIGG